MILKKLLLILICVTFIYFIPLNIYPYTQNTQNTQNTHQYNGNLLTEHEMIEQLQRQLNALQTNNAQFHEQQPNPWWYSIITGLSVGIIMLLVGYFLKKGDKVDDMAALYITKQEHKETINRMCEKIDKGVIIHSCKDNRDELRRAADMFNNTIAETIQNNKNEIKRIEDSANKNFEANRDEIRRIEDGIILKVGSFDRKFDVLNDLLRDIMEDIGFYKGSKA